MVSLTAHRSAAAPSTGAFLARGAGLGLLAGAGAGALGLGGGATILAVQERAAGGPFDLSGVLAATAIAAVVGGVLGVVAGPVLAASLLGLRRAGPTRAVRSRAASTAAALGLLASVLVLASLFGFGTVVGGSGRLGWQWLWSLPYTGLAAAAGWLLTPLLWPAGHRTPERGPR